MSFGAVGAYSCILTELVPSLRNEKKYGEDYIRPGDLIAKGSYYTGRKNYPWVIENMKKLGVKKVADLGCGSADVLISCVNKTKTFLESELIYLIKHLMKLKTGLTKKVYKIGYL